MASKAAVAQKQALAVEALDAQSQRLAALLGIKDFALPQHSRGGAEFLHAEQLERLAGFMAAAADKLESSSDVKALKAAMKRIGEALDLETPKLPTKAVQLDAVLAFLESTADALADGELDGNSDEQTEPSAEDEADEEPPVEEG